MQAQGPLGMKKYPKKPPKGSPWGIIILSMGTGDTPFPCQSPLCQSLCRPPLGRRRGYQVSQSPGHFAGHILLGREAAELQGRPHVLRLSLGADQPFSLAAPASTRPRELYKLTQVALKSWPCSLSPHLAGPKG